jgi:drug/metabolite transporter (DMT)-like permease
MAKKDSLIIILSYMTIYLVWGSTYFFIKMAVETIPPFYILSFRWLFGGVLFLLLALVRGDTKPLPSIREILSSILLGSLLLIGGNGLIIFAERELDSYHVALILASTPLIVAAFNRVLFSIRVTLVRVLGILVGVTGVAFLLFDGQSLGSSLKPEIVMAICGLLSWGFATSLGHRMPVHKESFVNSGIQMLFVGIVSTIVVSFTNQPFAEILPFFSLRSLIGLVYLAVVGSLAFAAYNYLIAHEPSNRIVSYAFVNPVIAVILGFFVGNEKAVPLFFAGLPLILFGLFLMLYGEAAFKRLKKIKQ